MTWYTHLFDMLSTRFMPHGYCYLWLPGLVSLHVISDGIIALSYMLIPVCLAYLVYMRKDIPFGYVFFCFSAFIVACGSTHIMEIWTLWHGDYWLSGFVKAITAVVSFATAIILIRLLPLMIELPSPSMFLEAKEANKLAKMAEEKFKAILKATPDAIMMIDQEGKIIFVNAKMENLSGYKKDELIGRGADMLIPNPLSKKFQKSDKHIYFDELSSNTEQENLESIAHHKNAGSFPVEINFTPLETNEGFVGLLSIRDITERKKIDNMKDEFISMVNHELRTPLTAIQGSLDLLVGGATGDNSKDSHELLVIARNNCKRLIRLINDILDIEKIGSGKMEFKFAPIEISKLVHEAVELNKLYGESFSVSIKILHDLPNVKVYVDADRTLQVLGNLLSNAIKFSPRDEKVIVTITQQHNKVRVAISDKGPGIPEEFQTKIFQKFSQADNSVTRERGGTGLGLSISKSITEKLNGNIHFTTSKQGTTFYFELPIW